MPAAYTSALSVQVLDFESCGPLIQRGCLLCGSCSSGQRFVSGFLQIPPHDGHPCLQLTVPPAGPVEDLACSAHASPPGESPCRAQKKKAAGEIPGGLEIRRIASDQLASADRDGNRVRNGLSRLSASFFHRNDDVKGTGGVTADHHNGPTVGIATDGRLPQNDIDIPGVRLNRWGELNVQGSKVCTTTLRVVHRAYNHSGSTYFSQLNGTPCVSAHVRSAVDGYRNGEEVRIRRGAASHFPRRRFRCPANYLHQRPIPRSGWYCGRPRRRSKWTYAP